MTDAIIKTTAKYQDATNDPYYQAPIIHITRQKFEQKQQDIKAKAEGGRENPFRPDGRIYRAVDPIVEQYKFSQGQSRPTSPTDSQTLIGNDQNNEKKTNKKRKAKKSKKTSNNNNKSDIIDQASSSSSSDENEPKKKSCWRRWWCCCCCCCCFRRKKEKSIETALKSDTQLSDNSQDKNNTNNSVREKEAAERKLMTELEIANLRARKRREELRAKRIEFIRNAMNSTKSDSDQNRYNLNFHLPDNDKLTVSAASNDNKKQTDNEKNETNNKKSSRCIVS